MRAGTVEEFQDDKTYPKLSQAFNKPVAKLIHEAERNDHPLEVLMLLCPSYPHNGVTFTYSDELVTDDLCPSMPIFTRETDKLVGSMSQHNIDPGRINFRPLVCEIEADLPNVLNKFANGDQEYFNNCIARSAKRAGDFLRIRYQKYGANITPGTFSTGINNDLNGIRQEISSRIANIQRDGGLPSVLEEQLKFVVGNRSHMFQNLYGAETPEEFRQLATRQMINYLAVTKAISLSMPKGALVLNLQTPNSKYVKQSDHLLKPILGLEDQRLPIYHFF